MESDEFGNFSPWSSPQALEDAREAELMMTDCSNRQGVGKPRRLEILSPDTRPH